MIKKHFFEKQRLLTFLLAISFILSAIILTVDLIQQNSIKDISNLKARSSDNIISVSWQNENSANKCNIELNISSSEGKTSLLLDGDASSYEFTEGVHGIRYDFSVRVKTEEQYYSDENVISALFINWEKLPQIPIVKVETVNQKEPSYEEVSSPEGCWGASVINNEYIEASFAIEDNGKNLLESSGKIRIRGNTSALMDKKPYKICLSQCMDLLGRDDPVYEDTEWLLIPDNKKLTFEAGVKVSELTGLEWEPEYQPVNLIFNGDWRGSYLLVESVKKAEGRVDISDSGFLIENDAYWWNANNYYFKTTTQMPELGYTFKYPDFATTPYEKRYSIQSYIENYEQTLLNDNDKISNYIDINSFASWFLTHDIIGTADGGGSNIYLYKYDLDDENPTSTKLKIGPAWDFDSSLWRDGMWSAIHYLPSMHFDSLIKNSEFKTAYISSWKELSKTLSNDMGSALDKYSNRYGKDLQESWNLDSERWKTEKCSFDSTVTATKDWFDSRTDWLNIAIGEI